MINRRIAGGVEDSGRMRGPWRRGQEDKDEEDERTRMRRTWMIFQVLEELETRMRMTRGRGEENDKSCRFMLRQIV